MEFTVSSRPGERKSQFDVSSRPQGGEPARQPGASLLDHYMRIMGEQAGAMGEGYDKMTAPGASLGGRALGAGQMALGGLGYAASPISAIMRRVLGNPAEVVAGAVGAGPEAQLKTGDIAGIAGEIMTPVGLPKAVQAAPAAARAMMPALNEAATAAGRVGRGAINSVEDLISSGVEGAQRRAAARAADAAPTAQQLGNMAQEVNQAAAAAGMNVRPEAFAAFADSMPNVLQGARITSGDIPISNRLYPETIGLRDRLEAYRGHPLTLDNLHTLQQEANGFVREALKAAEGNRSAVDVRGATIISRQIRDFVNNITPEMVSSGNPQQAAELLNRAKELWRREAKMNTVQDIVRTAQDLRDPKYLQSAFKSLVKDDLAMRDFTAQEQQLIRDIASGSRLAEIVDTIPGLAQAKNVAQKVDKAARGANAGGRVDAAQELMDMIARGEADQQARAAQRAAEPSFGQRIEQTLRPRVENTQTRRQRFPNGR